MIYWLRYNWSPFNDSTINTRQRLLNKALCCLRPTNVRLHLLTLILWPKNNQKTKTKSLSRPLPRRPETKTHVLRTTTVSFACRCADLQTVSWLVVKCCREWTSVSTAVTTSTAMPAGLSSMMSPSHRVRPTTPCSAAPLNTRKSQEWERSLSTVNSNFCTGTHCTSRYRRQTDASCRISANATF